MLSTQTQIAGFSFDNCLMNAAGVACMTIEELEEVKNSAAGTFVTKTATLQARAGNPEPRYQDVPLGSINSMGLPNHGLDYYLEYLLDLQKTESNRTFFLSLVGLSLEETHILLKKVQDSNFKGLTELNLSCPNVPGKPQIAYDFEATEKILSEVFAYFTKPLGIKLPPYFDMAHFEQAAAIFNFLFLLSTVLTQSEMVFILTMKQLLFVRKMALAELVVNTSNRLPLLMFMLFINGSILQSKSSVQVVC